MSLVTRMPEAVRTRLAPAVERLAYQDRLSDPDGEPYKPGLAQRLSLTTSRALVERGHTPPWTWSSAECRDFWAARDHTGTGNEPAAYGGKSTAIVDALDEFWSPDVGPADSVLELGCNAGANLDALRAKGFDDLAGVEISSEALEELSRRFPELERRATLHHGPAEEVMPRLADASVDVVFTMAVLLHIHPSSHEVLEHMVRIARRHVCVIEAEHVVCAYIFPRNYRHVFERLGCVQVREQTITRRTHPEVAEGYFGYTARLFRTPPR
jgi:SAM-dependent methyltransferase